MRIQERDKKIIQIAYEHGFIERKHCRRFFPNEAETSRRITELLASGLLKPAFCPAREKVLYTLNRRGFQYIEGELSYRLSYRPLSPNKMIHDSFVITARIRLEELWSGIWIPERLISRQSEIPDGIFQFPSGKRIFVELENCSKGKARFLRRLTGFKGQSVALYIATKPEVERSIRRTTNDESLPPLALISLESLLSPSPTIWSPQRLSIFHRKEF